MNDFVQTLKEEGQKLSEIVHKRLEEFKKPKLEKDEWYTFQKCHFCKEEFTDEDIKVRDHCHITGKFRGAAHKSCNLQVRTSLKIPVFFHNGSGYDFKHLLENFIKLIQILRLYLKQKKNISLLLFRLMIQTYLLSLKTVLSFY
jgi:hypothetical protein